MTIIIYWWTKYQTHRHTSYIAQGAIWEDKLPLKYKLSRFLCWWNCIKTTGIQIKIMEDIYLPDLVTCSLFHSIAKAFFH